MLYFKGGPSYYNPGTSYNSPTLYRCAKNYVILITDGAPTHDVADDAGSPIKTGTGNFPGIGDYDNDGNDSGTYGDPLLLGSHYLDDVAKYAHDSDLRVRFARETKHHYLHHWVQLKPTGPRFDPYSVNRRQRRRQVFLLAIIQRRLMPRCNTLSRRFWPRPLLLSRPPFQSASLKRPTSGDQMYLGMFQAGDEELLEGKYKEIRDRGNGKG